MSLNRNYLEINRQSWNEKTIHHLRSDFYDVPGFLAGKTSLNDIELSLMGDVKGKSILHLQCHFGQDTISLDRLGAKTTGVDLSDKAIESARELAEKTRAHSKFICCNVYDLPTQLDQNFDMVFISYGTISWLPDLDAWAAVISKFLKPSGQLIFVEFHPVVSMFDDDFAKLDYSYFNTGPIVETLSGSYADRNAEISQEYVMWNHGIGEVVNSLIRHGLEINSLNEYDYSPYNCFNKTVEIAPKKYRIAHFNDKIPMVYAIVATKKVIQN